VIINDAKWEECDPPTDEQPLLELMGTPYTGSKAVVSLQVLAYDDGFGRLFIYRLGVFANGSRRWERLA
jgi:hypothetical protein